MTGSAVRVLFENTDYLAADKPEGVVSIAEAGKGGLPEFLKDIFPGRLFPVHRLDREASGVIVYAKNPEAHRHLNGQFDRREVRKTYLALVHGTTGPAHGLINAPIHEFGSGRMGVDVRRGKPSSTEWKVAERLDGATLVQVHPATGRRHQIRVHLYHIGHPIVGDLKYGDQTLQGLYPRLMLHALAIEFDILSGERVTVEAPAPKSFEDVCGGLRKKRIPT